MTEVDMTRRLLLRQTLTRDLAQWAKAKRRQRLEFVWQLFVCAVVVVAILVVRGAMEGMR